MATTEVRILHTSRIVGLAVALVVAAVVGAPVAQAGVYPGNKCVSSKQKEAGIQVISFDAASAKQYYAKAYEVAWENAIKASPQYGPQMRKLFSN